MKKLSCAACVIFLLHFTNGFADYAYVPNMSAGSVSVIDTETYSVVATITASIISDKLAITPDGKHLFASGVFSSHVSVISAEELSVIATITVASTPQMQGNRMKIFLYSNSNA